MSIATEIQRLQTAKANIKTAIENQGVTVGDGTLDTYAALISQISGGGGSSETPTINGMAFDCGTFSFEADQTANFTVQHNLGMMPVAGFMWVVNPPLKDEDGNNLQYQYGKIRTVNLSDSENASYGKFGAMLYVARGERSAIKGSTYEAGNFRWTAETVTFCCSSTYPLRAGLKYQWLLIGGADA